ncbi:MAG: large conductance mechanosensitive channel protein MscL [Anaerovoracaceae bacterium]
MWKEFKEFAFKGNVLDLAVAVIMGAAIGKIVTALVDYLLMPIIGMICGGIDFSGLAVTVGQASLGYGQVIQAVIDFLIIAFFIFLLVKAANKVVPKKEEEPAGPTQEELLSEIRDLLKEQNQRGA